MDPTLPMPAPYLYGTHYSTPGYVVYWLARAAPGHLLRLQVCAGAADRAVARACESLQPSSRKAMQCLFKCNLLGKLHWTPAHLADR